MRAGKLAQKELLDEQPRAILLARGCSFVRCAWEIARGKCLPQSAQNKSKSAQRKIKSEKDGPTRRHADWLLGTGSVSDNLSGQVELNRKPRAFVDTNPTPEPITSGLRVIQDD
jgi:hypothetical protein